MTSVVTPKPAMIRRWPSPSRESSLPEKKKIKAIQLVAERVEVEFGRRTCGLLSGLRPDDRGGKDSGLSFGLYPFAKVLRVRTAPDAVTSAVHDRMPVILNPGGL